MVAISVAIAAAVGCGRSGDLEKVIVSGEVTYKGQPVSEGDIRFEPMPGTKGPLSGAVIRGGRYTAEGRGGVPVGEHVVRIRGYRTNSTGDGDLLAMKGAGASSDGQYIPPKYNRASQEVVTVEGDNSEMTLDFHLD